MRPRNYVLDEHGHALICDDLMHWAAWMERERHEWHWDTMVKRGHGARVSTIFLGIDHNHAMVGQPILWETMVFDARPVKRTYRDEAEYEYHPDYWQDRYATREEATVAHELIVSVVAALLDAKVPLSYDAIEMALGR